MPPDSKKYHYELLDIKFAVVALQLGLITKNEAENALYSLKKRNIEPTEQNYAKTLLILSYLTKKDIEILDYYTKNQAEITWCQDCIKNYIVTNYRADRNYNCPICSGPLYLVRSMNVRFNVDDLEVIDGLDPLSQPFILQMQGVKPDAKNPDYQKMSVKPASVDDEDLFNVYDSTIPKFGDGKTITTKLRKKGKDSDKIKNFNIVFKQIQQNKDVKPEAQNKTKIEKKDKAQNDEINVKLQKLAEKDIKSNQKSIFATMKEADLDVKHLDLQQPVMQGAPAEIFPQTETTVKKFDKDTKISLSPIPSVGSKVQIASNDRYVLIKEIARGGMGVVYLAFDQDLRRYVAMKVIKPKENLKVRHIHRFIQESQILSQLEHPNNVPIHEFGVTTQGHLFFTMKYIEGISLAYLISKYHKNDAIIKQTYPLKRQLTILLKVFDAIAYAHARGVVHRDLKPENIMIGAFGEVVVMDWGLAKVKAARSVVLSRSEEVVSSSKEETSTMATQDGQVVGTPTYMPPEQTAGKAEFIDERCDIYALGAIIYEVITGRPPFIERDVWKLIKKIREGDFPAPSKLAPEIDKQLEKIILTAMSLRKEDRFQTVYEFKTETETFLNSTTENSLCEPGKSTDTEEQIFVDTFDVKPDRTPEHNFVPKVRREKPEGEHIKHQSNTLQKALEILEIQSSQSNDKTKKSETGKIKSEASALTDKIQRKSNNPEPTSIGQDKNVTVVQEDSVSPNLDYAANSTLLSPANLASENKESSTATKIYQFQIQENKQSEIPDFEDAKTKKMAETDDDVLVKMKKTKPANKKMLKALTGEDKYKVLFYILLIVMIVSAIILSLLSLLN